MKTLQKAGNKTELIQTRVEAEVYEALRMIAKREEMSISQLTRRALKQLVNEEKEAA